MFGWVFLVLRSYWHTICIRIITVVGRDVLVSGVLLGSKKVVLWCQGIIISLAVILVWYYIFKCGSFFGECEVAGRRKGGIQGS